MKTEVTDIWAEYQRGVDYQRTAGLSAKWPEFERFKSGDQWPNVTEATKTLPRPVLNMIEYLIKNKKANVLSQAIKLVFASDDMPESIMDEALQAANDFTDYASYTWYDLGQDNLNSLVLEDAATLGCGIWHYYWDGSKSGGTKTKYVGGLAGEVIDPACFFPGNPQNIDVQTQPYILIASRDDTEATKERLLADKDADKAAIKSIQSDTQDDRIEIYDSDQTKKDGDRKTTIITKYYRQNGQVYLVKSAKEKIVMAPRPLNGNRRYPLEVFQWRNRKRSIFGASECEGLIPAQKAVNLMFALLLLCLQDMGFPKMVVWPNALKGQKITGKMSEILVNQSMNPDAIQYLNPPQFNNAAFSVVDNLIGYIRTFSGVTEVLTGDRIASDMAAGAIIAIQAQSKVPLKDTQNNLYRSQVNIGRIWEEFFKNYQTMERPLVTKNEVGISQTRNFNGSKLKDFSFDLKVKVGPASEFGEALSTSTLDRFYDHKDITVEDYIKYAPPNVVPFAEEMKRDRANQEQQTQILSDMVARGIMPPEALHILGAIRALPQQVVDRALQSAPQAQQPGAMPEQQGGAPNGQMQAQG